jgi:DNA-binding winged helix-turn-helix (wHTH) protein
MTLHVLKLGTATYDPTDMSLTDAQGAAIGLTRKGRALIACLADAAGDAVARETIVNTVWPQVPVEEATIARVVAELREAIGDRDKAVIRTVPKVGYQLVGQWVQAGERTAKPRRRRWPWVALAAILALVTLRALSRP